ncbi:YXWGXW repeat-containing protein [Terriglobus saanensis]|uniref:YXWGXW repeat-containing protein n=1 Tax=Terriglobus saanensis (strain ATCC BAA-1853 / DSM 23119 / SP1PR4) TaxID=401053 RepID=E8UYX1_TERSS|nr:YXWGXW repeat-containing protein [Terriglobus saanensis]ADV84337.1 hypothetical protein AciPR4_3584 [Terriglobus saanensis SP1PR4]
MKFQSLWKTLAVGVLSFGMAAAVAEAQVYVHIGPPRPIVERRPPPPRPGYVWRAGYHRWDGGRYVWVPGEYLAPPRPHAHYYQGAWVHDGHGYRWRDGYWR